jgi:hypothetical protein
LFGHQISSWANICAKNSIFIKCGLVVRAALPSGFAWAWGKGPLQLPLKMDRVGPVARRVGCLLAAHLGDPLP